MEISPFPLQIGRTMFALQNNFSQEEVLPLAIYHCSIKIISRGKGKSAVAAAAYRAAENITSEYDGRVNDYTKKTGVVHTGILLPENTPIEYENRAVLWNAVEMSERYKTAQLAREIEVALPRELTREQNFLLVQNYVKHNFVDNGMCVDICIHDKNDGNPHAHILLTMRPIEIDGSWGAKSKTVDGKKVPTVDWSDRERAEEWRESWASFVNSELAKLNIDERVDHRSFKRQGKDEIPTIHLGAAAHQMEKRGIKTERGNINREIEITNKRLRQLKRRISKLQTWLDKERTNDKPPMLADVITNILEQQGEYGLNRLKSAAEMLVFLRENQIQNFAELDDKLKETVCDQVSIQQQFKPIDRRLNTLDEHIKHCGNFKQYRSFKVQYEKLNTEYKTLKKFKAFGAKRKAQKAFDTANDYHRENKWQIIAFETAEQYLKDVLQDRFDPKKLQPITKWKAEKVKSLGEKTRLNGEYKKLKSDVDKVSKIRSSVDKILSRERRRTQPQQTKAYKDRDER